MCYERKPHCKGTIPYLRHLRYHRYLRMPQFALLLSCKTEVNMAQGRRHVFEDT